jgi:hypothetical protein
MKLRIRSNSIRLRLLQGEVTALGKFERVQETTRLGPAKTDVLIYSLSTHVGSDDVLIRWHSGTLGLSIRQTLATELCDTNRVSIEADLDFCDEILSVLIEKDFKCLTVREGDDESDNFKNPQEKHECAPK